VTSVRETHVVYVVSARLQTPKRRGAVLYTPPPLAVALLASCHLCGWSSGAVAGRRNAAISQTSAAGEETDRSNAGVSPPPFLKSQGQTQSSCRPRYRASTHAPIVRGPHIAFLARHVRRPRWDRRATSEGSGPSMPDRTGLRTRL
jgi:hypothetical protein